MFTYFILFFLFACATDDANMPVNQPSTPDNPTDSPDNTVGQYSFLALGDSYTIGESVDEAERWPVQLASRINSGGYGFTLKDPKIIARTGWTTKELKSGIASTNIDQDYDLVSLLIGVNNQYRGQSVETYKPEFRELLNMAIEFAGGNKEYVIVLSIPDYGYTPFGADRKETISKEIDEYNAANKQITDELGIKYYNITDISRSGGESLVASDGLHPSGKQYSDWVAKILADSNFINTYK